MSGLKFTTLSILFLAAMILYSGLFIVRENEVAVVLRLGQIEKDVNGDPAMRYPGLHFKIPFITTARIYDQRLQTLDIASSRIVTSEKKSLLVDYYVKWRIDNLPTYYIAVAGNKVRAQTLLEQKINDGLRAEIGQRTISEVVSGDRVDIMQNLTAQTNENSKELGIEVIDVRIKRIDLPYEVSQNVYKRMRSDMQRIATEHRAKGKSKAEALRAKADANVTVTLAQANSDAARIRGEGDAMAAKIANDSYGKNSEFFKFYRSMQAYRNSFKDKNDVILLKPDSEFFDYFKAVQKATG